MLRTLGRGTAAGLIALAVVFGACGQSPPVLVAPPAEATREVASPTHEPSATPSPTATPAPAVVTLAAVGDIMLARSVGERVLSDGPGIVFGDALAATLSAADLTIGNLESPVSERGWPQDKSYTFRAPLASVGALELAGFDVVSLANNHALDYGPDALADTASEVRVHGIQPVGAGEDIAAARAPAIFERGGLRFAFVGLVDAPAEGEFRRATWEATEIRPGVAWADRESVTSVVSAAAQSADVVVVMLHFGIEYGSVPSASQRELARAAIDAGAALVVGSHPHVLQEVEEYGGGLIAYSLGNFVFDGFDGGSNESAILMVTFVGSRVSSWELFEVELVENGLPRLVVD